MARKIRVPLGAPITLPAPKPADPICDSKPRRTSYAEIIRMLCNVASGRVRKDEFTPTPPTRRSFPKWARRLQTEFRRMKRRELRIQQRLMKAKMRIEDYGRYNLVEHNTEPGNYHDRKRKRRDARLQAIQRLRTDTVLKLIGMTPAQARRELESLRTRLEKV